MIHRYPVFTHDFPFQLIIVFRLHHLVPFPEQRGAGLILLLGGVLRVQIGLQNLIQCLHSQITLTHGRQHLDIKRPGLHISGKLFLNQQNHMLINNLDIAAFQEKEIPAFIIQRNLLAVIDFMGVDHDIAFPGLAENLFQLNYGKASAVYQITEHLSRPHRRKLVHIPHQNQPGSRRNCTQKRLEQMNIHHGHLIHNDNIRFQWIFLIFLKTGILTVSVLLLQHGAVELKQAVNGARFIAGGFRHPLSRPAGRRCKKDIQPLRLKITDHSIDRGCFSRSRPS